MPIQSLNPANGNLLRSFDPLTSNALEARLAIAASAARTFALEPVEHRAFWRRRPAALREGALEELAAMMTAEMGKTLVSARAEVKKCAAVCHYYAENAVRMLSDEPIPTEHIRSFVRFE